MAGVDLSTRIGKVVLPAAVLTASGTSGHGAELAPYGDLGRLGAVVVKSLAVEPWPGNPAPRVRQSTAGMLNSVGLQGPGLAAWMTEGLPTLAATGARVVVSLWGRTVEEYAQAAKALADAPPAVLAPVVAVELNVSCPNVEDRSEMFAHSARATADVVAATGVLAGAGSDGLPRWVKLSPNVTDLTSIAGAALDAGADGLTLVNTLLGLAVDLQQRRPALGAGGGGLSGPALHPVAVRAVYECRAAFPQAPILGVGGVMNGADAIELIMAGADAVQVGTATFADPRAPWRVLDGMARWCRRHQVRRLAELKGVAHG